MECGKLSPTTDTERSRTMSLETRHTEKNLLFQLLKAKVTKDYETITENLIAIMEPEDVELVKKQVADWEKRTHTK
jgi:hypothetical protein